MTNKEQIDAFGDDLDKLVQRYSQEFDLTYAQVVGTLQMKIHLLCDDAKGRADEA